MYKYIKSSPWSNAGFYQRRNNLILFHLPKFTEMGCGESKHDVASGNTITRKKSDAGEQSKKSKDIENASLLAQQQGKEGDQNVKHNNNEANGDLVPVAADHHIKDIAENTEAKEGDSHGNNKEKERLIAKESPNRFFSSRKEEESIDGIEGRSEKSEYDSPRPEVGKESLFNDKEKVDDVNAVTEEKKLAQETIPEAKNGL